MLLICSSFSSENEHPLKIRNELKTRWTCSSQIAVYHTSEKINPTKLSGTKWLPWFSIAHHYTKHPSTNQVDGWSTNLSTNVTNLFINQPINVTNLGLSSTPFPTAQPKWINSESTRVFTSPQWMFSKSMHNPCSYPPVWNPRSWSWFELIEEVFLWLLF